jgi:class 3 adenylate cyclase
MPEDGLLAVLDGTEGGRRIPVSGPVTFGRDDDADVVVDDAEVSRTHAVVSTTLEGLEIQDLGSLNGTWVNGERISGRARLAAGDVVKLGTTRIEVLEVAERPLEDELRPVSVLFADVVGSTPLAERLAPEDYGAVIAGCVDRMCRAVERFGGVIDAYMGDGIAAYFGFPAATEDDAGRAANAALVVMESLEEFATEVRKAWNLPDLSVRVGVNSGQVAIGVVGASERHPVALGDTMGIAARLQAAAAPGTIVIGGPTAAKLHGRFLLAPLGHLTVRGRDAPVEAWRLLSSRTTRPRHEGFGLVGRAGETARLASAADALRAGRGQLLVIDGEPGIGKTRLVEWLRDRVQADVTWLEGRCCAYGGQPLYHAPADALRGWVAADDVEARTSTLERLGLEPDALPYLATLLMPDAEHDRLDVPVRRAYSAWIRGLCGERPVVLAVHDLHWADHATLELVDHLVDLVDELPFMIVATSRGAGQARWNRGDRVVEVALGPLDESEAEELLSQLAPGELNAEARAEVLALAEGNPLYVEHLLRSLLESGGLAARRTWALTTPVARLPTGLESLLVARIAALPRDARRVAQAGAVLGRTFAPTLLAAVSGVTDVEPNLTRLLRANLIREIRAIPNREFAFTHGLLQEAALSTLTRARRRELYRLVADAHERQFVDSLDDQLEQLAFYCARGGDHERALDYLERAANRAMSQSARTQAAALWSRAARVAERISDPEARSRIEQRLAQLGA